MDIFLIKLLLAFIVGSAWVTITTIIAEKFGSKIGGLIGGLPSTVAITLFFIGITQSPKIATQATTMLPFFYLLNGIFLIIYALLIKKGLFIGLVGSLLPWFVISGLVVISGYENFVFAIIIWIFSGVLTYYIMEKKLKIKSTGKVKIKYTIKQIIGRALLSGSIITLGVFLARIGGPIFGGMFSAFPALFISTLIITYLAHGWEFSRSLTKTLMVSGMINVVIYSIAVRYLYLSVGLISGTLISLLISLISAYFTYNIILKRMI